MKIGNVALKATLRVTVPHVHNVHQKRDLAQRQVTVEGRKVVSVVGLEAVVPLNLLLKLAVEMNHQSFISISLKSKSVVFTKYFLDVFRL